MGTNLTIMFSNHSTEFCPYIILVNTDTGERTMVVMDGVCEECGRRKAVEGEKTCEFCREGS